MENLCICGQPTDTLHICYPEVVSLLIGRDDFRKMVHDMCVKSIRDERIEEIIEERDFARSCAIRAVMILDMVGAPKEMYSSLVEAIEEWNKGE